MKFFTGITKLASRPPWSSEHEIDGQKGYWAEVGHKNHPVFLRSRDSRIHLPKSLRGKSVTDIRQDDLDSLDKTDSGHTHYKLWKSDFDRKRENDKIYDGYHFTAYGLVLLERLKRFFTKYKLDNVETFGIDPKYNVHLDAFDALINTTDINKVKRIGRTIAKKYRMIIEMLKASGKTRLATKFDKDFYYNWDKVEKFFDFDPITYKPALNKEVEEETDTPTPEPSPLMKEKDSFSTEVQPLIHPQMAGFAKAMAQFELAVNASDAKKAKASFQTMNTELMRIIGMGRGDAALAAEKILHLPAMASMYHQLFSTH